MLCNYAQVHRHWLISFLYSQLGRRVLVVLQSACPSQNKHIVSHHKHCRKAHDQSAKFWVFDQCFFIKSPKVKQWSCSSDVDLISLGFRSSAFITQVRETFDSSLCKQNTVTWTKVIVSLQCISIEFWGLTGSMTAGSPFSPFWPKAPAAPATCSYKASTEVTFFTQQL